MNENDKRNLMFLLRAPQAELDKWTQTATTDDIMYALELMAKYFAGDHGMTIQDYMAFSNSIDDAPVEEIKDVSEAKEYLSKFMLNK